MLKIDDDWLDFTLLPDYLYHGYWKVGNGHPYQENSHI
jgi:hypothetical protein